MEAARIVGSMPVITGHMKEVGYSSNYIKGLERSARWLHGTRCPPEGR